MTTPTPGIPRHWPERITDALTITLAASDLLEQLASGRLERSLDNLRKVSQSLHQAASLTNPPTLCHEPLSGMATDARIAAVLLGYAANHPDTLTPERYQVILATLYQAADALATFDPDGAANREEARS